MPQNTVSSDFVWTGEHTFSGTHNLPSSCVSDTQCSTSNPIDTDKQKHRHSIQYYQADGTDIAAATVPIFIARAAGTIIDVEVVCVDAPSGGDKTFTVDIQKADVAAAAASVLSSAITYPAGTTDYTVQTGTITTTTLDDGDTLLVVVAVSGSTGNQGQGLIVTVTVDQSPS